MLVSEVFEFYTLSTILGTIFIICSTLDGKLSLVTSTELSCLNEDGKSVDWFIAYKFPEVHETINDASLGSGYAYGYIMSDQSSGHRSKLNKTKDKPAVHRNQFSLSRLFYGCLFPTRDNGCYNEENSRRSQSDENPRRSQSDEKKSRRDQNSHWTLSDRLIKDDDSIIFRTLRPAFKKSAGRSDDSLNLIFYNDQPPAGGPTSNDDYAHSKGVVLMDETSKIGIWLTHSTPRFPPQHINDLKFEKNAAVNGQTFMCVTFDLTKTGDNIAKHLVTMKPQIYDHRLSAKLLDIIPEFRNLKLGHSGNLHRRTIRGRTSVKDDHLHQTIETYGGQQLNLFSKSRNFQRDLYADWLVNELDSDLFVETWRNGGGSPLNSSCPLHAHKVNNVSGLKIDIASKQIDWRYTHDHSKWAITQKEDPGHVCIGDINRMHSQFRRGGGIVCIESDRGWNVFRNTIGQIENC